MVRTNLEYKAKPRLKIAATQSNVTLRKAQDYFRAEFKIKNF